MSHDNLTPAGRVALAREVRRPGARAFIDGLIEDFFELHGDRRFGDDGALVCGIGRFRGTAVTVAGTCKGRTAQENLACNFGMPGPEGYRKFQRALDQAVKFGRPVMTFIDTPGAFPGRGAEERGQGEAIARCLAQLSSAPVPVLAVLTGEGGSGGALALAVADRLIMLENAVFSILSPEGFASILWKDPSRAGEACEVMKLTASDLHGFGIADHVVPEPPGGAHPRPEAVIEAVGDLLQKELAALQKLPPRQRLKARHRKYRGIGL